MTTEIRIIKNEANEGLFNSIQTLKENGGLINYDKEIEISEENGKNEISFQSPDGQKTTYILSEDVQGEAATTFNEDGASWFDGLRRGEKLNAPDSEWADERRRIAEAYHKKYFAVYCEIKDDERSKEDKEKEIKELLSALNELWSSTSNGKTLQADLDEKSCKKNVDTFYCAKLKTDVSANGVAVVSLIYRLYYRLDEKRGLVLLDKNEAKLVHDGINENLKVVRAGSGNNKSGYLDLCEKVKEDLNSNGEKFSDYALLSESEERKSESKSSKSALGEQIKKVEQEAKMNGGKAVLELDCKNIELISVAKIGCPRLEYSVTYNGVKAMRLDYDVNGISLRCLNCCGNDGKYEYIIRGNKICFAKGVIHKKDYNIYEKATGGKKTKEAILKVFSDNSEELRESEIFKHLVYRPSECTCDDCSKAVCEKQVDSDGYCKYCPKPEIIYTDPTTKNRIPTKHLYLNADNFEVTSGTNKKSRRCEICGRQFATEDGSYEKYCILCKRATIITEKRKNKTDLKDKNDEDYKRYKIYRNAVNPIVRLFAVFKPKICLEDKGILLFVIGKRIYKFDKLLVKDKGYVKAAKRYKEKK